MSILLKIIQAGEDTQGGGAHPTPPLWQRVLAMEVARSLCSDGELLRNLWRWYDSSSSPTRVFTSLISALHRIATENPGLLGTSSEQMTGSAAAPSRQSTDRGYGGIYEAAAGVASATMSGVTGMMSQDTSNAGMSLASAPSMQVIDQLDKAEAPATPSTYVFLLALQSLVCLAQSFANYVLPQYSAFANARPASASRAPPRLDFSALPEKQQQEMERVRAMAEAAWPGLLASFTFFLTTKCDDFLFCGTSAILFGQSLSFILLIKNLFHSSILYRCPHCRTQLDKRLRCAGSRNPAKCVHLESKQVCCSASGRACGS